MRVWGGRKAANRRDVRGSSGGDRDVLPIPPDDHEGIDCKVRHMSNWERLREEKKKKQEEGERKEMQRKWAVPDFKFMKGLFEQGEPNRSNSDFVNDVHLISQLQVGL